ncbi:hypothetical protein [Ruminococcus flavefaciens]|uniref:hypothetical protein n=1 Tax=Ruminococcus flavefaciens TaxID=1265 RepID=UPI000491789B|nr:hypothetical protein [Ruminococcus flavefaciens]
MNNQWGKGGYNYPQVGQKASQAYVSRQFGQQMLSQTFGNGAGVSPALNVSYSRRYSAFPQAYSANMQNNCMNTQFSTMEWSEDATSAAYSASTYGTSVPDMDQRISTQSAAISPPPLPPPQPVAQPQPLPPPQPVVQPQSLPPPPPQVVAGFSRRNLPPQGVIPDVVNEQSTYKLDFAKYVWYLENSNNKGKVRTQDLTSGFIASGITKILTEEKNCVV